MIGGEFGRHDVRRRDGQLIQERGADDEHEGGGNGERGKPAAPGWRRRLKVLNLRRARRDVGKRNHRRPRDLIAARSLRLPAHVLRTPRMKRAWRAGLVQADAARANEIVDGAFGRHARMTRRTGQDVPLDQLALGVRQLVVHIRGDERIDGGAIRH